MRLHTSQQGEVMGGQEEREDSSSFGPPMRTQPGVFQAQAAGSRRPYEGGDGPLGTTSASHDSAVENHLGQSSGCRCRWKKMLDLKFGGSELEPKVRLFSD